MLGILTIHLINCTSFYSNNSSTILIHVSNFLFDYKHPDAKLSVEKNVISPISKYYEFNFVSAKSQGLSCVTPK